MIQFSIPAALGIFATTSAVAVTSVAVAVPAIQPTPTVTASAMATPTATPTTATPVPVANGGDSPVSSLGNHEVGFGLRVQDLALGISAMSTPSGAIFSYVGSCTGSGPGSGAALTVWGNNGQRKSWGSAGYCNGGLTYASATMPWNEDTRNGYCYSPQGGASAYRAEAFGQFSEWVSIPNEYRQCVNNQSPEGPPPPDFVAPPSPPEVPAPVEPVLDPVPDPAPEPAASSPELTPTPAQ